MLEDKKNIYACLKTKIVHKIKTVINQNKQNKKDNPVTWNFPLHCLSYGTVFAFPQRSKQTTKYLIKYATL